ncbi:hypothetical protein HHX47_DHR8000476 [Lentinula edodes]|nr:hypothetical protein HHX47_DHR8000476 [Lentinula edodes]
MTLSLPQFLASNFQAISHLTTSTSSTALSLASQSHQTTQEIHQARALISDSAYHLSDVLNTLAGRTTDHIESLDVKVEELKDKLLPPAPKEEDQAWFSYDNISSERWWKGNLVWVLGFLIRATTGAIGIDPQTNKVLGLSAALEPSVRQYDPRVPQTRIITSRIRLLGTSASSAAATRSRVSRIPDRLCIPSLA